MPERLRNALPLALVAVGLVAVLIIVAGAGGDRHEVTIVTKDATGVVEGMAIRAAGQRAGTVSKAEVLPDRRARLVLAVDDDIWPLPRDTKFELRLGGTVKYTDRYIDIRKGSSTEAPLIDGAVVREGQFKSPVNFDTAFGTFDAATRGDLARFLKEGGESLRLARTPLRRTLDEAPAAVGALRSVLGDLADRNQDLDQLVRSGDAVVDAVDRSTPGIGDLLNNAEQTFDAVGRQQTALRSTLDQAPATFATARTTLRRAESTLVAAGRTTDALAPGIAEARRLARPLVSTLSTLTTVAPDGRQTLASLRRASPDLSKLLTQATSDLPVIGSVSREAAKQLNCIRPYAPEIAGLASTWGPGAWGDDDGVDTFLRAEVGTYPFSNATTGTPADVTAAFPQVRSIFPRPPGENVRQPWLIPECNLTEDVYDPKKDPEAKAKGLNTDRPIESDDADAWRGTEPIHTRPPHRAPLPGEPGG